MPIGGGYTPVYDQSGELSGYGYQADNAPSLWSSVGQFLGSAVGSYFNQQQQGDPLANIFAYPQVAPSNIGLINVTGSTPAMGVGSCGAGSCGTPFATGCGGGRAHAQDFELLNPTTGKLTRFKPAGRVLLTSSDMAAARKVKKLAAMARRRVR